VDKEEFNRVDGLEEVKDVWTTLRMAYEGSKPMRKAKIDMLEGQLNRFVMFDDETPQDMFNRLKKLVNKAKGTRIQEMDRPHVDGVYDESLHTNELQSGCLDSSRPRL
jgi:hypothetical protein